MPVDDSCFYDYLSPFSVKLFSLHFIHFFPHLGQIVMSGNNDVEMYCCKENLLNKNLKSNRISKL